MTRPLDAQGIDPCRLISVEQADEIGLIAKSERRADQSVALRCRWEISDVDTVQVSVATDLGPAGISDIYRQRVVSEVFELTEVAGYPAVRAEFGAGLDEDCNIYVGVADDQLIAAATAIPSGDRDPCAVARQLATYMISNLPPR